MHNTLVTANNITKGEVMKDRKAKQNQKGKQNTNAKNCK